MKFHLELARCVDCRAPVLILCDGAGGHRLNSHKCSGRTTTQTVFDCQIPRAEFEQYVTATDEDKPMPTPVVTDDPTFMEVTVSMFLDRTKFRALLSRYTQARRFNDILAQECYGRLIDAYQATCPHPISARKLTRTKHPTEFCGTCNKKLP